jgi:hypothetical protein
MYPGLCKYPSASWSEQECKPSKICYVVPRVIPGGHTPVTGNTSMSTLNGIPLGKVICACTDARHLFGLVVMLGWYHIKSWTVHSQSKLFVELNGSSCCNC